jgi:hypothetical protein
VDNRRSSLAGQGGVTIEGAGTVRAAPRERVVLSPARFSSGGLLERLGSRFPPANGWIPASQPGAWPGSAVVFFSRGSSTLGLEGDEAMETVCERRAGAGIKTRMDGQRAKGSLRQWTGWVGILCWATCTGAYADPIVGTAVSSPTWEILVTDFGYADFALDRRPGFVGREYLSGEWAAAVGYESEAGPVGPIWLQPQWFYPDWISNSDFGVEQGVAPVSRGSPTNAWGFPVFQSTVTNGQVRITLWYEMMDSGEGIAAGIVPRSRDWPGRFMWTDRYVFRQTCVVSNRTSSVLRNVRWFQFVHGLESMSGVYDDREYGGSFGEYRYDLTLHGRSVARDTRTDTAVLLHDVLTLHAARAPAAWEVGYYGRVQVDSHIMGKPSVGVHWSVETNALNGLDFFAPPEGRYVSGALAWDLGDLAPGRAATHVVLLTVATWRVTSLPGAVQVHAVAQDPPGWLRIAVEPRLTGWSRLGLLHSTGLQPGGGWRWRPLWWAACEPDPGRPGCYCFQIPMEATGPAGFFRVEVWQPP